MKKLVLPSIVIGIVLFLWQFISYAAGDFHSKQHQYTDKQDQLKTVINEMGLEKGSYMIPSVKPGTPMEEMQSQWDELQKEPWMFVTYYGNEHTQMAPAMIRGFLSDIVLGLLLMLILNAIGGIKAVRSIMMCVSIGIITFLYFPYTNGIWYPQFDIWASFLDSIVPFAIIGIINARFWNKA